MLRLILYAVILVLSSASLGAETRVGSAACGPTIDNGSPGWIDSPDRAGKSGTPRWTLDRLASRGPGTIIEIGNNQLTFGVPGRIYPDIRGTRSTVFDLFFADARPVVTWEDTLTWMAQVRALCGSDCPRFALNFRWDLITPQAISRVGTPWLADDQWFLKSPRTALEFAAAWPTTGCQGGTRTGTPINDELWDQSGSTGCGATYTGTGNGERNARLPDILDTIAGVNADDLAYYIEPFNAGASVVGLGLAVMANMQDAGYRQAMVDRCRIAIEAGFDFCGLPHKNHQHCARNTPTCTAVNLWPNIAGDGLGGYGHDGADNTATIDEIAASEGFSGPMFYPDGVTPFLWEDRSLSDVQFARDLDTAGLPTMVTLNPYWLKDCSLDYGDWEGPFHDDACEHGFEGPNGAVHESDNLIEYAMRADAWIVSTGGKSPADPNLGSGIGSGHSFYEIRDFAASFPSPDGTPPEVLTWEGEGIYGGASADPACVHSSIAPATALPVCGNGVKTASEACDDGNTVGGDGCSKFCRLPKVGVVIGQSNQMPLNSTQNQDITTGNVTSPDTYSGGSSRFFRFRHVYDVAGGYPTWVPANEWPFADSQCAATGGNPMECTGQNRTAAGHPDTTAATACSGGTCTDGVCVGGSNPGVDCDGTCLCTGGSSSAATEHASPWPTFAQRWMQDAGTDVDLIFVVTGATGLVCDEDGAGPQPLWDPYVTDCAARTWSGSGAASDERGDLFCGIFEAIEVADVDPDWFLWLQGEEDASCSGTAVTGPQYEAALTKLADELWSAYQAPLIAAPISMRENTSDSTATAAPGSGVDIIHDATESVIASHPHVYMGPDTDDLEHESGGNIHIKDVVELGKRWYEATAAHDAGLAYTGQPYNFVPGNVVVADLRLACGAKTGSTYAAPVGCFADVSGTVHTDPDVKIGDLRVLIDWDDADLTTYDYGPAIPKQFSTEPFAPHLFTAAGTYDVVLTVTDAEGNTDTDTAQVVVTAQDTAYTDANTRCVCDATLGNCTTDGVAGFAGCPLDNNGDGDCTDGDEIALASQCVTSAGVHNAAAFWNSPGRRTLFRRGDTYNLGGLNPVDASSNGSMVGAYGSGARPKFLLTNDAATLAAQSGWKSIGIHYDGTAHARNNDEFPQVWGRQSSGSTGISDLLLYDNVMEGVGYAVQVSTAYTDAAWNDRIFITGNEFTNKDAPGGGDPGEGGGYYMMLLSARDSGVWDNVFNQEYAFEYNGVRLMGNDGLSIAHNYFNGTTAEPMSLQDRSCADSPGSGCTREDRKHSWFGNVFNDQTAEGGWPYRCLNSHDGQTPPPSSVSARKHSILYRSNTYLGAGAKTGLLSVFALDGCEDTWIENNVADLRGLPNISSLTTRFARLMNSSGGTHGPVRVAHNTIISSEGGTGRSYNFCTANEVALTGSNYCNSNLWWEENAPPSMTTAPGAWTLALDNEYLEQAAQSPFYGTADNGTLSAFSSSWLLSRLLEARIRTSGGGQSLVVNEAYPPSLGAPGATLRDWRGFVRADSTPTVGAFEDGAVDDW